MKVHPYGEGALYVDLELDEDDDRAAKTHAVAGALRQRLPQADVVVGAGSVALVGLGPWDDIDAIVVEAMRRAGPMPERATHDLDTLYDGPDLDEVAQLTELAPDGVAELHASRVYVVELVGFLPGFAYLGTLDPRLVVPRRASPRPRVVAGSLGIAGPYTGVYPLASPGGWRLIGRVVDSELFDPSRDRPALLEPGDRVRFVPRDPVRAVARGGNR